MAKIKFVANYKVTGVKEYATIEEAAIFCQSQTVLGLDIETTRKYPKGTFKNEDIYQPGLDPYLSEIVMIQIGTLDCVYVIDTRCHTKEQIVTIWKNSRKTTYITVNGKFEAKHLLHNYGILHHQIHDCMLCDMVLTNGLDLGYSMEKMVGRYLDIHPPVPKDLFTPEDEEEANVEHIDKSTRMGFLTIGNKLFTEKQILYGADDIVYPLQIRELQLEGYLGYKPVETIALENEFCLVLADIELQGITFNKEKWLENYEKNLIIFNHRKKKMNTWVETNHLEFCTPVDLFNSERVCTIEWGSSKQVIELFKFLKFCPKEKSKETGRIEYTVGSKTLTKLLSTPYKELYAKDKETDILTQEDLILNYLLLKKSEQSVTTFGDKFLKYVHPITGKLHSSYRQIMHTGRMCVDVNTLIDTNIGYIRIGSLIPSIEGVLEWPGGIKAKTHTGEYHKITHGINKGTEEMYRVTLESGHEILCTMGHKFLTEKGWYSLEEIVSSHTEHTILYDASY